MYIFCTYCVGFFETICFEKQIIKVKLCTTYYAGFPPHEKKIEQGVTQLSTWTKRGGILTDAWVCLFYWVVIWVAG